MDQYSRSRAIFLILFIMLIAMMLSIMFTIGDAIDRYGGSALFTLCIFVLFFIASFFLHIWVHEFGHAVFGKLSGYTLFGFSIAGVWSFRTDTGRKLRFFPVKGVGGAAISVPKDGYTDETPYTMMIMGGIIMNIIATAVFFVIAVINISPIITFFAWIVSAVGLYSIASNLIPLTSGFVVNDGALLRLFRRDAATKHCMRFMQMETFEIISGTRNDLPAPADLPYGNQIADVVRITLANRYIAQRNFNEAEHILRDLLNNTGNGMNKNIAGIRLLFIHTIGGAGKETVDEIYDERMKRFVKSFSGMDLYAILFLVAYEKRFGTGAVKVDILVKRFNKITKKVGMDTSFERSVMESLISDTL